MNTKVAIYARYSTDKQDESSITGQVRNCRELAEQHGFAVIKTYSDEAMSGTDLNRPGLLQMMADLEAEKFDGILVDETSRLSRTSWSLNKLIEEMVFRDQFIMDCKGFDSRNEAGQLLAAINGAVDGLELRKIKARTHRGLRERAENGFSAGGKAYGYGSVAIDPTDPKTRWNKVINEDQAKIVREIFKSYADGMSPLAITRELNLRGIPSPGASWKRRTNTTDGKWRASAIYGDPKRGTGILCNALYRGEYIWNRTEWRRQPGTKKRKCLVRPESEWQRKELPELRIVDDALWIRAQIRIQETRVASKKIRNALHRQARTGRPTRYLLSGLMKCSVCGSNYIVNDKYTYSCSAYKHGHACDNHIRVKRAVAESVILDDLQNHLLSDRNLKKMRIEWRKQLKAIKQARASKNTDKAIQIELAEIDKKLHNLVGFIAEHGGDAGVKAELDRLEARRDQLLAESQAEPFELDKLPDLIPDVLGKWRDQVLNLVRIPSSASVTQTARAKTILLKMLGEIPLEPDYENGHLWALMGLSKKPLVQELTKTNGLQPKLVAGAGFEPATFGL